nr:helix-turn-helix transcriptional regulator [Sedimentibacter sp.]
MTDTLKLRAAILQSGLSRREIAKILGISMFTLHKKIHNVTEFKASEIALLTKVLDISDKESIFFVN